MAVTTPVADDGLTLKVALLTGYTFLLLSRLIEFIDPRGILHLMLVGAVASTILAIVSGGFFKAMGTKTGMWLTFATLWMFAGVPFSMWVGGSVNVLVNDWMKSYLLFFMVAGLITTLGDCRRLVFACAAASAGIVITVHFASAASADGGRLTVDSGTLGNSNDLAALLLICLPFCAHVFTDKKRNALIRWIFVAISAAAFIVGMQTGSRAALICVGVLALLVMWKAGGGAKFAVTLALVGCLVAVPFVLTDELKARYLTIFKGADFAQSLSADDAAVVMSALDSTEARSELMKHAMDLTIHHPLFGVGIGQFQIADAARAAVSGEDAYWHQVHNGFMLIAVEDGIPALIAFLVAFGYSWIQVFRIYNTTRGTEEHETARLAFALLASLTAYFVCLNFSPAAYNVQLPLLCGFASAFAMVVQRDRAARAASTATVVIGNQPAPVWNFQTAMSAQQGVVKSGLSSTKTTTTGLAKAGVLKAGVVKAGFAKTAAPKALGEEAPKPRKSAPKWRP